MFAVEVRDHILIAHSLPGEVFGPAQKMHGATFVVDVAFFRQDLDPDNIVVDIGRANEGLKAVLQPIHYTNLDEHGPFRGKGATITEFLSRHILDETKSAIGKDVLGPRAAFCVNPGGTLSEKRETRGWYE